MVFDGQQINTQNQVSSLPRQFLDALSEILGRIEYVTEASGGSISRALVATAGARKWFVKLDETGLLDMFEAEADGLRALAKCPAIRVPQVIGTGCAGQQAYLILEHIELQPLRENGSSASAGRALADLHRIVDERFGWSRDNFIGSTPQSNRPHADWAEFFARERLLPQLDLTRRHGHSGSLIDAGERLIERLHVFFSGDSPAPSLLHGDLWNGNAANDRHGKFVLYDPAVHFGDRETDLAMSELFGGFPASFYAAYREAWPLSPGYPQRRKLYQLYHILNHFNLFGGGYRQQAEKMIRILLAEIG